MGELLWVSMPIIKNIVLGTGCTPKEMEMMCQAGGISLQDLEDANMRLSLEQNCAIMEMALTVSGNATLGLHVGEKTTAVVLGITGHLMQTCPDVLSALQGLQQFTTVFTRLYNFYMEVESDHVFYYCEPLEIWNDVSPETARQSVDIAYAGALHILYLMTGKRFTPKKVLYRYTRVANLEEYERILRCRPQFGQSSNCIVFALEDLQVPVIGHNKELNELFKKLLDAEVVKQREGASFGSEVKQTILTHFQFRFPTLEEMADFLHITPRTLQRKLQQENTSFRLLTDDIKKEIACHLLSNKKLSVSDVAYRLGYAEPSTFQRAFRQWVGQSPHAFRRQAE